MKSIVAFALFVACVAQVQSGCVKHYPSYDYSGVLSYDEPRPFCGLRNHAYASVGPYYSHGGCGGCGSCSACKNSVYPVPSCGGCGSCSSCKKLYVNSCGGCGRCSACTGVHNVGVVY